MDKLKHLYILSTLIIFSISSYSQTNTEDSFMEDLRAIKNVPVFENSSGDYSYWKLVQNGKDLLPLIITHLNDTTTLSEIDGPGLYKVQDICVCLFNTIVNYKNSQQKFSTSKINRNDSAFLIRNVEVDCSCYNTDNKNKKIYKAIKKWYKNNQSKLQLTEKPYYVVPAHIPIFSPDDYWTILINGYYEIK